MTRSSSPKRALAPLWLALGLYAAAAVLIHRSVFRGEALVGRDLYRIFIPQGAFLLDSLRHGSLPLWIPLMNLGQPFVANPQARVFYPLEIPALFAVGAQWAPTLLDALHEVIAALGIFALCRRLGRSVPASLFGGAAFGFSALMTQMCWLPHMVDAAAWSGWILVAAHRLARAPRPREAVPLAGAVALSFLSGSPETALWQSALALTCVVFWAVDRRRAIAWTVAALIAGIGLCGVVLVPAGELASLSTRKGGLSDALEWSMSWVQLLATVLPNADSPRDPNYWGADQSLLASCFLGTLTVLFATATFRRGRRALPLGVAAVLFALLSLGRHFPPSAWILLHVPPLTLFRHPTKYLVSASVCLAVVASYGIDALACARRPRAAWWVALGVVPLGAAVAWGLTHAGLMRDGVGHGAAWALAWSLVMLGLWAWQRRRGGPRRTAVVLAMLGAAELAFAHPLLEQRALISAARLERPSLLASLLRADGLERASVYLDDPATVATTEQVKKLLESSRDELQPLTFLEDGVDVLEGYGPLEPTRVELFQAMGGRGAFDLAGITHYVRRGAAPFPDLTPLAVPPGSPPVYRSQTALPRAFLTQRSIIVSNTEAMAGVSDPQEPARRTAFLAAGEPLTSDCAPGEIHVRREGPNELEVIAAACAPSYLVVSEAWFPGWQAEVDEVPTPVERADYALRAVKVPSGLHRVRMVYRPRSLLWGSVLSTASLLALVLASRRRPRDGLTIPG